MIYDIILRFINKNKRVYLGLDLSTVPPVDVALRKCLRREIMNAVEHLKRH